MSGSLRFSRGYWSRHAPSGPARGGALRDRLAAKGAPFAGDGTLHGLVTIRGVPAAREVLCLDRLTKTLVASVWSDPATGAFQFTNLDKARRFRVEAVDYSATYNAVVADNVLPE